MFALGTEILPFKENKELFPLQELHIGTIRSPFTAELITCAPRVAAEEQPKTEQDAGQGLLANLVQ